MPGYNPQQLLYKVQNANACSILIGDQLVGFGQTLNTGIDMGGEGLYGIGDAKPQEIQQLKFTNSVSLNAFYLTAEGAAFFGQTANLSAILANNQFNIYLVDNDQVAFLSYVGCVAQNTSIDVSANQPLTEAISFLALDVLDPDGNSVLNSNSAGLINALASATNQNLVTPGG